MLSGAPDNRARRRSGCPPSTSSSSRGSRARPLRRWGCRPWRGCRRRSRRCRRRGSQAPSARAGRATRSWSSAARYRVVAEAAPVASLLIDSFGIDPSTTSTNGSSSPRSALKNHSKKSSARPWGRTRSRSGASAPRSWGGRGSAPSAISSMVGCVAAVSATESPSQLRPALIQRMWITVSSGGASVVLTFPPWDSTSRCVAS